MAHVVHIAQPPSVLRFVAIDNRARLSSLALTRRTAPVQELLVVIGTQSLDLGVFFTALHAAFNCWTFRPFVKRVAVSLEALIVRAAKSLGKGGSWATLY